MRLFKPNYRDKQTAELKPVAKWWIETRDHLQIVRRFPAFKDKAMSRALGEQIEQLILCRMAHQQPDRELTRWLERIPTKLLSRLAEIGVLDMHRAAGGKPLFDHIADFRISLIAKGDTREYAALVSGRAQSVIDGCGFRTWSDIRADRIERYLADRRSGEKGISAQTSNFHLQAAQQFCRWMVQNRRASESPLAHLKKLNVKTDRRHDRTAFEVEEVQRLLAATYKGPVRFGMAGPERALLYRFTVETGLRRNELRSLRVSSFDFAANTVTVEAAYSKHRQVDVLPVRPETAAELQAFFAGKLPEAKAFGGSHKRLTDKTALVIQEDLAATVEKNALGKIVRDAIPYTDSAGRFRDFHALRHTCGSWLAANGVHPKVIQEIMRHGDINLTMTRYGHTLRGQTADAVAKLPSLPLAGPEEAKATGTDDQAVGTETDLASGLALSSATEDNVVQASTGTAPAGDSGSAVLTAPGRIRTCDLRFRKPMLYPAELRARLLRILAILPVSGLFVKCLPLASCRLSACGCLLGRLVQHRCKARPLEALQAAPERFGGREQGCAAFHAAGQIGQFVRQSRRTVLMKKFLGPSIRQVEDLRIGKTFGHQRISPGDSRLDGAKTEEFVPGRRDEYVRFGQGGLI
jgi:integrase